MAAERPGLPEEERLVVEARGGNLGAFNELVRRHQDLVYNLALRMLGNEDQAADVTQNAFLSAYQRIADLRGAFRPWLCRIAVNGCYNLLRRRGREVSLQALEESDPSASIDPPDPHAGPEELALQTELRQALETGVCALPPEQRAVLVLIDLEGFSYQEVSSALGVELGTVKSRLNRGRLRLRDEISRRPELLSLLGRPIEGARN